MFTNKPTSLIARLILFLALALTPLLSACEISGTDAGEKTENLFDDIDLNTRYGSFHVSSCLDEDTCAAYLTAEKNPDLSTEQSACAGEWLAGELCPYSTRYDDPYEMRGLCEEPANGSLVARFYYDSATDITAIFNAESACKDNPAQNWLTWTDL